MMPFDRTHNLTIDKPYRLANDCVMNVVHNVDYNPHPPPEEGYMLYLNGSIFTLLNGQNMTLL